MNSPSIAILTPQEPRDTWLIDKLWSDFNRRHAWLIEAGEKLRKEREEDYLTPSLREQSREPAQPNKRAGRNNG